MTTFVVAVKSGDVIFVAATTPDKLNEPKELIWATTYGAVAIAVTQNSKPPRYWLRSVSPA